MEDFILKDICEVNPKDVPEDMSQEVSFVPMQAVSESGSIDVSEIRITKDVCKGYSSFSENDVLMAKITPCFENGKCAIARGLTNGKGYGSTEFLVFRPNTDKVLSEWLYYFTISNTFRENCSKNMTGTAGQKRVPKTYVERQRIKVPSLEIQKNLTNHLGILKAIIAYRMQELELLDELIKARFVEMFGDPIQNPFGWQKKRFDEICENLDSRRKPITSSDRVEGIYPYYGASGIVDYVEDYIFDEDILLVSEDGANLLMRSTPIAFSVSGKVWVNNHAHVVRFEKMCLQKYIEIFFSLIDISDSITGSAQPKLNQAKLNEMEFPIPEENLLEDYLGFLKQVDKSKVVVQKSLDETEQLFDCLMQEYFG